MFFMVEYISLSSQVNQSLIIGTKLVYTSYLGNYKISGKSQNFIKLLLSGQFSQNANFISTSKNLLNNRNWTFPVVRYFAWKLEHEIAVHSATIIHKIIHNSSFYVLFRKSSISVFQEICASTDKILISGGELNSRE